MTRNDYYKDKELQTIASCQRNFDVTRDIDTELRLVLDEWIGKPPEQCGELRFNIIQIHNQGCQLHLSKILSPYEEVTWNIEQPQVIANVTYVWTVPNQTWFNKKELDWNPELSCFHIGFHAGLITKKVSELGLVTGFTQCGPVNKDVWQDFKTKWNIDSEKHDKFGFALGVGYPLKDKPYYWQYSFGDHVHCVPEFPKVDII